MCNILEIIHIKSDIFQIRAPSNFTYNNNNKRFPRAICKKTCKKLMNNKYNYTNIHISYYIHNFSLLK